MKLSETRAKLKSKHLSATDLDGRDVRLTMDFAEVEEMPQSKDDKDAKKEPEEAIVVYFTGAKKALRLNVINGNVISGAYGDETDDWHDRELVLYPTTTTYRGKVVPCVRVRIPKDAQDGIIDDIPF